ncbi:expressed unknown protein [Seminavis robusta]|uniref:PTM/DIR17-like Tudor domain-containing protein n=1 Tax=Seminavis robusta TaxID=568900 RepID=A0A9N8EED3_9STRA|nr:expressed unknown protein [Seminavis robusta]|eukprot:Sro870_g213730.1 n/a (128) ;mRNA; r:40270-40724
MNEDHDPNPIGGQAMIQTQAAQEQTDSEEYTSYPIGARFFKLFPGGHAFQGEIMSFDGSKYTVWYEDGDEEHLGPEELEEVYFILPEDHPDESDRGDQASTEDCSGSNGDNAGDGEEEDVDRKMPAR